MSQTTEIVNIDPRITLDAHGRANNRNYGLVKVHATDGHYILAETETDFVIWNYVVQNGDIICNCGNYFPKDRKDANERAWKNFKEHW